jgi:hypothetical protein
MRAPILTSFSGEMALHVLAYNRFLTVLRDAGVLTTVREGSGRRPAIYAFPTLLNIAEGRAGL